MVLLPEQLICVRLFLLLLAPCLAIATPVYAVDDPIDLLAKGPKKNWSASYIINDSRGAPAQGVPPYFNYDLDLYENIDYNLPTAANADITTIRSGLDDDFLYLEISFVNTWNAQLSQTIEVGVEIDTDHPVEANRGDFLVALRMKSEFNPGQSENWTDVSSQGGYDFYEDQNNDVGGADPLAPDGTPGNGYETNLGSNEDVLWARVNREGIFEVAISRDAIGVGSPAGGITIRTRVWSSQLGDLVPASFSYNDNFAPEDIANTDNFPGANIDFWTPGIDPNEDQVDLSVSQTLGSNPVNEGDIITITTTITNLLDELATGIFVETLVPDGLTFVSATPSQGNYNDGDGAWSIGSLDLNELATLTITASVDAGQLGNSIFSEAGLDIVDQFDINAFNNVGSTVINVAGYDGTIEFVGDLAGAPFDSAVPGDTLFIKVADLDLNQDDAVIEEAQIDVSSDGFDHLLLTLTETAPDSAEFTGSVATEVAVDPIPTDNILQLRATDTVIAEYLDVLDSTFTENQIRRAELEFSGPSMVLTKSADRETAIPGEEITYKVIYTNLGVGAATDLRIGEQTPSYTTYVVGSMRIGLQDASYATATPLSDADDGVETTINGADVGGVFNENFVKVSISSVAANDNVEQAGNDGGSVFFKVTVDD